MDTVSIDAKLKLVIAILTMDDDGRQFRGNRNNFEDLISTGEELGAFVYVTTPRHLKLHSSRTFGYRFDTNSRTWIPGQFPLPRVIYNRIPFRKDEVQPEVQELIQACLRSRTVKLFNPGFFNKWTLFEWLGKVKTTKRYIPVTKKLTSSEELDHLLRSHPTLYLKPERGKAGKGIMKVQRVVRRPPGKIKPKKEYWLTVQSERSSQTSKFAALSGVWSQIRHYVDDEEYIVQQGIPLSSYKKRPFDLRVLAQKTGKGEWEITGVGARVAGKSSITTHVPRGGSIDDPERLLTAAFGAENGRRLMIRLRKAALLISRQIEKKSGHMLGEMSMDLGVDNTGSIWFFEANAKPMKFDEPHIRKKSLERIIQYCYYLSKSRSKSSA